MNGNAVERWRQVAGAQGCQMVRVQVDSLEADQAFECSGLDGADLALAEVELRQLAEVVERPRPDGLDRVPP